MTSLILIKLELISTDVHIIEEKEFITGCYAYLIFSQCFTSGCGILIDSIVDTEGMNFPSEGLYGLEFGAWTLHYLYCIADKDCDHIGTRKELHLVYFGISSLASFVLRIKS